MIPRVDAPRLSARAGDVLRQVFATVRADFAEQNNKNIDVAKLQKTLRDKYKVLIDGGYGQIKGKSFRLAHMGDETLETVAQLHAMLDDCLKSL